MRPETPEETRARVDGCSLFYRGRYTSPRGPGAPVPPGLDWTPKARIAMKRYLLTGKVARRPSSRPVESAQAAVEDGNDQEKTP